MALGIMLPNVFKLCRLTERRFVPVQLPDPAMQRRIPGANIAQVALEMLHVHGVEADDRRVESDVCLCDLGAEIVGLFALGVVGSEVFFCAVQRAEEGGDGVFVGRGGRGEARFVDAVVDVVVGPFVCGFDVCAEGGGEEVDGGVGRREQGVEFGVEHTDYFRGLVGDDTL